MLCDDLGVWDGGGWWEGGSREGIYEYIFIYMKIYMIHSLVQRTLTTL